MASSKDFVESTVGVLNLATNGQVSSRPMMGEYVVYYRDKVIGGIYDNRLLIKVTPTSTEVLSGSELEIPYEGAKKMLRLKDLDDLEMISSLFDAMYEELPKRKPRAKKSS